MKDKDINYKCCDNKELLLYVECQCENRDLYGNIIIKIICKNCDEWWFSKVSNDGVDHFCGSIPLSDIIKFIKPTLPTELKKMVLEYRKRREDMILGYREKLSLLLPDKKYDPNYCKDAVSIELNEIEQRILEYLDANTD